MLKFLLFSPMPVSVTDLGLFTDSINLKYKEEMLAKARNLITNTICDTIFKTIQDRVNRILHKLPLFLSISDIIVTLFGRINNTEESKLKNLFFCKLLQFASIFAWSVCKPEQIQTYGRVDDPVDEMPSHIRRMEMVSHQYVCVRGYYQWR
ncbi:BPI2 domain-containing protein [Meloidogyne graminicola]|uniref:BPI2 domain-containing protein n=1 Tax=Meloidogyne graminicola TaxID=189291 RepID=A0A8S9ZEP0_9BILA|nr:BPI2 domain-containing protein [Meloidogyne graminicola]